MQRFAARQPAMPSVSGAAQRNGLFPGAASALRPIAASEEVPSTLRLEDRMTPYPATRYRPYLSNPAAGPSASAWVQIDLGSAASIDALRFYPNFDDARKSIGFP